jgi:hypothetical protein
MRHILVHSYFEIDLDPTEDQGRGSQPRN